MTIKEFLSQCEEIWNKATKGQFEVEYDNDTGPNDESFFAWYQVGPAKFEIERFENNEAQAKSDADFYHHARNTFPTLLKMLKVTIDALEQIKAAYGDEYECVDIKAALKKCEEMVNG